MALTSCFIGKQDCTSWERKRGIETFVCNRAISILISNFFLKPFHSKKVLTI